MWNKIAPFLRRFRFNAPVVLTFTAVSFLALLLNMATSGASNRLLFSVYPSSMLSPLSYVRFFTYVLGHANWQHFINNILLLLVIGPLLEEKYGSRNLALVIVVTALIGGVVNVVLFPHTSLLGASGVVFAFILLASITRTDDGSIPLTFVLVFVLYIGEQVVQGLSVHDHISNSTHIVGGIIGSLSGFAWNRKNNKNT